MKNNKILVLTLCLVLVLGLSFTMAATNKSLDKAKKVNYGSCVSAQTKIKNSCFKVEKESYKTCQENKRQQVKDGILTNKTEIKAIGKSCREDRKIGLKECKVTFKASKAVCEAWKCNSNKTFENGSCKSD
jgi:hypothetical protein